MSSSKESDLREHTYKMALAGAILLISGATIFYHFIESWTWVDSFYFSSVAITTVGFGDLSPTTDAAKLFTVAYIFSGLALVSVVLNERLHRRTLARHFRSETEGGDN
ncbi:MAG: potassium channel family protein [Actinomycetia bacterium]|nr:potassium channel family protein [Actinomycetes bacterium]